MNTINTELALNLMNLSEESLIEINKLLNNLIYDQRKKDKYINILKQNNLNLDDFINYCQYELKLIPKSKKRSNNIYYKILFNKYQKVLTEIISNETIFNFINTISINPQQINKQSYLKFIDYISSNYQKKRYNFK